MNFEDKLKKYKTIQAERCPGCGNPWFFVLEKGKLQCTTCSLIIWKEGDTDA